MTQRTSEPARPRWIALRRLSGEPVTAGGFIVTPQSRALTVCLPFAAFVWQRPISVTVEQDGRTTELPIRDVTRLARFAVTGRSAPYACTVKRGMFTSRQFTTSQS